GCWISGGLICPSAPRCCLFATISCVGAGKSGFACAVVYDEGRGALAPARTESSIGGCVKVRKDFCSGSKKLNEIGGRAFVSALWGVTIYSKDFAPCRPSWSVFSVLMSGGW